MTDTITIVNLYDFQTLFSKYNYLVDLQLNFSTNLSDFDSPFIAEKNCKVLYIQNKIQKGMS